MNVTPRWMWQLYGIYQARKDRTLAQTGLLGDELAHHLPETTPRATATLPFVCIRQFQFRLRIVPNTVRQTADDLGVRASSVEVEQSGVVQTVVRPIGETIVGTIASGDAVGNEVGDARVVVVDELAAHRLEGGGLARGSQQQSRIERRQHLQRRIRSTPDRRDHGRTPHRPLYGTHWGY